MKVVAFFVFCQFQIISIRAVEPRFGVAITTLLLGSSMFLTWFAIGIVTDICIQKHEIEGHLSMQMYTFVQSCRQHDREQKVRLFSVSLILIRFALDGFDADLLSAHSGLPRWSQGAPSR